MLKRISVVTMLFVLALAVGSCRKLEPRFTSGAVSPPSPKVLGAIPLEYGDLIAAAPSPDNPYWFALWFQKPDKTLTLVYVNASRGLVVPRATIPRK